MAALSKYRCAQCGHRHDMWVVRCAACGEYLRKARQNADAEPEDPSPSTPPVPTGTATLVYAYAPTDPSPPTNEVSVPLPLTAIDVADAETRVSSGIDALDDVLGGGIVVDSVILLSAEPGAGKSTLLMQMTHLARFPSPHRQIRLYASAEESTRQVAMRAKRLNATSANIHVVYEHEIETILAHASRVDAALLVVDSIQTMSSRKVNGAPGSNSQISYVIEALMHYAKRTQTPVFAISHVNKDGRASGTMKLEHGGDVTLEIETHPQADQVRVLRSSKNRHGSTQVEATFRMTDHGLEPISPDELPDAEETNDMVMPFTQELIYLHLEAGLEIPNYLRDRADRRLDFTPRGGR